MNLHFPLPQNAGPITAVEYLPLEAVHADPRNPRLHSKRQIRQIARSIEAFGFNVPVLIDRNNQVIAGHGRLDACRLLCQEEVPTIRLDHLTPAQARAFMIADNKLATLSDWDDDLLGQCLKELSELDLDFSIEATGFEMGEIDLRIEQLEAASDKKDDPVEPPAPDAIPVSSPGSLWQLGDHRILCGNALVSYDYAQVMGGKRAQIAFTDAPYNVKIDGNVSGKGAIKHREFAMASGEMTQDQFTEFLGKAFHLMSRFSVDGAIHFACMDWRHLPEILAAGNTAYSELKNLCVWVKDNAGMGSLYRSAHELVLVFKNGTAAHINNVQLGSYGRYRSNIWRYAGVNSFGRATEEGNLLAMHPTVKPVAMIADALFDCSNRGDIVLDPFLGSGSTLIAAERTGRQCRGIELDPLYVDTAVRRWQKHTGLQAVLVSTGLRFNELEAMAGSTAPLSEPSARSTKGGLS